MVEEERTCKLHSLPFLSLLCLTLPGLGLSFEIWSKLLLLTLSSVALESSRDHPLRLTSIDAGRLDSTFPSSCFCQEGRKHLCFLGNGLVPLLLLCSSLALASWRDTPRYCHCSVMLFGLIFGWATSHYGGIISWPTTSQEGLQSFMLGCFWLWESKNTFDTVAFSFAQSIHKYVHFAESSSWELDRCTKALTKLLAFFQWFNKANQVS